MRRKIVALCCFSVALAVTARAQWRHVSDRGPYVAPSLERAILAAHNEVRARVDVPPLHWSDLLAAHAQEWANHLLASRQFYHRPHPAFGENIFDIIGPHAHASPDEVVGDWASESHDYNYRANTCHAEMCGHYTQLVWSNTREVGCAVARDSNREVWVCNYNPPGNWIGERPY